MRKRYWIVILTILVIIFGTLIWFFNVKNQCGFWDASFTDIISIFLTAMLGVVGLLITLLVIERKNDLRRYCDAISIILDKIDNILCSDILLPLKINTLSNEYKNMLSSKRNLSNYISILKLHSQKLEIENEINFINEKFHEYETTIDACISLRGISDDLRSKLENLIGLIQCKVCETRVLIHKKQL